MKWLQNMLSSLFRHKTPKYPKTVAEVLNDGIRYKKATIESLERFKKSKPFHGTPQEIEKKFGSLHKDLCVIYNISPRLILGPNMESCYIPYRDIIVVGRNPNGRYSVVAYLHEFRHALGTADEYKACRWSLNLFRQVFPEYYEKLVPVGHLLVKPDNVEQFKQMLKIK